MEMTKRYMKIILMVFPKIISEKLGHFLPHNYGLHNSGPASLIFFKILNNWRGRELGHNLMIFFCKKKAFLGTNSQFWTQKWQNFFTQDLH